MEIQKIKGNKPELPVDFNGNAIQAWTAGGKTIDVEFGEFTAESSIFRVCTGATAARIKLKGKYLNEGDSGTPIPPNTVMCLGCEPGDVFEVEGSLSVTFVRERDLITKSTFELIPSVISWTPDKIGGSECNCEIKDNVAEFSGYIDYYYSSRWGNKVGVVITPSLDVNDYPNLVITINKSNGEVYQFGQSAFTKDVEGKSHFVYETIINRVPEIVPIVIDWTGKGDIEAFYIKVTDKAVLRNG